MCPYLIRLSLVLQHSILCDLELTKIITSIEIWYVISAAKDYDEFIILLIYLFQTSNVGYGLHIFVMLLNYFISSYMRRGGHFDG